MDGTLPRAAGGGRRGPPPFSPRPRGAAERTLDAAPTGTAAGDDDRWRGEGAFGDEAGKGGGICGLGFGSRHGVGTESGRGEQQSPVERARGQERAGDL